MPSLAESRRQVEQTLHEEVDHDALLASLQDEIDKHNAVKHDFRESLKRSRKSRDHGSSERPVKFRFKSTAESTRDHDRRKRSSRREKDDERRSRRKRRKEEYPTPTQDSPDAEEQPHPFPREPADPTQCNGDAFRASLFDALADDEGAAAYWENVYNQPIHIYPRPAIPDEATGELEEMNDEEYVDYVKRQMWERKHPEVVVERRKREREKNEEEEARTRRREEFVRRKEQAAWERSQRRRFTSDDDERSGSYEYKFAGEKDWEQNSNVGTRAERHEYVSAWTAYLEAWSRLQVLLAEQLEAGDDKPASVPSKQIPWPVLKSKPPTRPNIEAFVRHAPGDDRKERLRLLKAERVRWHPDKMQQRFRGAVDEGTMKLVTGVFQVIDGVVKEERKKMESI